MNEENVTENDRVGGISLEEYNQMIDFINDLREKSKDDTITREEKILSEVLYMIITKEKDNLDYNTYYHRRLGYIKPNELKSKATTQEFRELVWWLQEIYWWEHVEWDGIDKVRFDWDRPDSGKTSLWLKNDKTIEGTIPNEIKSDIVAKGIKISNK